LFEDKAVKLVIEFDYAKNENREVSKIRMDVESMHKTKEEGRKGMGEGRRERGGGGGGGRGEGEGRERRKKENKSKNGAA